MFKKFIFAQLITLCAQNAFAMGPACFTYEAYEHQGALAGANNALLNYTYALISARNGIIPPLAIGGLQIQVSLLNAGAAGPWNHNIALLGGGLTHQEACMIALERQGIGIRTRFQHPLRIQAVATGSTLLGASVGFPGGLAGFTLYLNRALGGGGYRPTVLAAALYRLRNNVPYPNFVALPVGLADTVLIHIHNQVRVSKNAKELSYNSILNNPAYHSLKDIIDAHYNALGLPPPDSATVLSSDNLQLN